MHFDTPLHSTLRVVILPKFCTANLTLRPLACRLRNGELQGLHAITRGSNAAGFLSVDDIVAIDTPGLGTMYYLKSAVKYYLHEVADALPAPSGAFISA